MSFIVIEKIVEKEVDKKDNQGMQIYLPNIKDSEGNPAKMKEQKVYLHQELICLRNIRSAQPWTKINPNVKMVTKQPVLTMIFIMSDGKRREDPNKKPSILINESFESFSERVGAMNLVLDVRG